jgi:hypothetical protein
VGLVVFVGFLFARCDPATLERWGLRNEVPLPPRATDVLCDSGRGSTCDVATLTKVLDVELTRMAARPGSVLRVWPMGERVSETVAAVTVLSPTITKRGRLARSQAIEDFVSEAKAKVLHAVVPYMTAMRNRHRSPIAESITRIAWAAPPVPMERRILVISDGREIGVVDGECGDVSPQQFLVALDQHHALPWGSLRGIDVEFEFVSLGDVDHGRCPATLERASTTRELWRVAMRRACAHTFTYRTTDEAVLP